MTQQAQHTPGPWLDDEGGWIKSASGKPIVEYLGCGSHEAEWANPADKSLALAAPDLMEALSNMVVSAVPGMNWTDETGQLMLRLARAAIAKARGES